MEKAPMCSQCDLMKIAKELGQMPLVLTPEETSRVLRVATSSVYAWASQGKIPVACKKPLRFPTIWVMKMLGFGEEQHEKGLKLVSSK